MPTPAGLPLFELLKGATPALVDPGMTAVWEIQLDEVAFAEKLAKEKMDLPAGYAKDFEIYRRAAAIALSLTGLLPLGRGLSRTIVAHSLLNRLRRRATPRLSIALSSGRGRSCALRLVA